MTGRCRLSARPTLKKLCNSLVGSLLKEMLLPSNNQSYAPEQRWPTFCKIKANPVARCHWQEDAEEISPVIESLVAQEADRRVAIWLRLRLGGERITTMAADNGYRDGSGIHRVVQRLEKKANDDQASRVA